MIDKPGEVTSFNEDQIPMLTSMFNSLFNNAISVKYTSTLPTASTVSEREVVVYDDGAGTKRIYVITAQKNLGYINLT